MHGMRSILLAIALIAASVCGQQVGTMVTEVHPSITTQVCSSSGCTSQQNSVTIDANWRWLHNVGGSTNCYTGNSWSSQYCSTPSSCTANCALEGADSTTYSGTYGVTSSGTSLNLGFVTHGPSSVNVGSRLYLMADDSHYQMFKLKNQELAFDVDVSGLPCGLNGAVYFVEMSADGGMSKYSTNAAGAKYGTGYCDAQCPHDLKFINGEANVLNWVPSSTNVNSGTGQYGTCCTELDIWEANKISTALTPHPCSVTGQTICGDGTTNCGDGSTGRYNSVCDKDGCDFNPFRMGNTTFYGPNMVVNTNSVLTVVTQFITSDNTANGDLVEMRRLYKQNGVLIANSASTFASIEKAKSITNEFCANQKSLFGDQNEFTAKGGLTAVGESMDRGHVLVISLWDDYAANCLWLDSDYPSTASSATPGVSRGTCATTSGVPSDVEANSPSSTLRISNIKWGAMGTTTPGVPSPIATSGSSAISDSSSSGSTAVPSSATASSGTSSSGSDSSVSSSGNSVSSGSASSGTASSGTASSGTATSGSTKCNVGAVDCACTDGGSCDKGLTCLSKVCVDASLVKSTSPAAVYAQVSIIAAIFAGAATLLL